MSSFSLAGPNTVRIAGFLNVTTIEGDGGMLPCVLYAAAWKTITDLPMGGRVSKLAA